MSDLKIEVTGIRELRSALKQVESTMPRELRKAWNAAAEGAVKSTQARLPKLTGRAAGSVRARSTQTEGRIVAGGGRVPYYHWLDFGGRVGRRKSVVRPFIRTGRYVFPAIKAEKPNTLRQAEQEIRAVIRRAGFTS